MSPHLYRPYYYVLALFLITYLHILLQHFNRTGKFMSVRFNNYELVFKCKIS
jgi:hypothetical protein